MVIITGAGWRGEGGATGIWWVEARDAAQHPTVHSMTPTVENDLAPDVSGALMGTETDQGGGVIWDQNVGKL